MSDPYAIFDTPERRAGRIARNCPIVVLVPGARVPAELDAEDGRHAGNLASVWVSPAHMNCPEAKICFVEADGSLYEMGVIHQQAGR